MVAVSDIAAAFIFFLTVYVNAAPQDVPSAASFYIPSLPDLHQDPNNPLQIFAGYISVDPNASSETKKVTPHLYFFMVKNRRLADKRRLLFWFNGGPGCSSFDGLMMEIGPWRTDGNRGWNAQDGGWEEYMTMVYVDQPAGTGFSYTSTDSYVHTTDQAAAHFLEFLRNFYKVFPEYKDVDTYLGGESFAGQWIPWYAHHMLNSDLSVPLRGIVVGNGWLDPKRHYSTYLEFVVKVGLVEENSEDWRKAKGLTDHCMEQFEKLNGVQPMQVKGCEKLVLDVVENQRNKVDDVDMCLNIYDVRKKDTYPDCGLNWPPDIKPTINYLGRPDVVRALHAIAPAGNWIECRSNIHASFKERTQDASVTILPELLEKIPVLLFAGDQDLICNYVGLEAMINELTWNGAKGLGTVETQSWSVNNVPAGTWVSSRNLTYAKIFNASHMAPYDVPHVAHDMILRFVDFNFSAVIGGSAGIPSSLGNSKKPTFSPTGSKQTTASSGKTPEQDKAMWEAYYNAGSAALVLLVIFSGIGLFIWCRNRRRGLRLPLKHDRELEESIPLNTSHLGNDDEAEIGSSRKGKGRAVEEEMGQPTPIFDVGDSDEDDELPSSRQRRFSGNQG